MPASADSHGVELTARKSAQFSAREVGGYNGHPENGSDDDNDGDDAMRSTNVDRYNMERMGKLCCNVPEKTFH